MAERESREVAYAKTVQDRPSGGPRKAVRARAAASALSPGTRLGRFMIVDTVGEGGMGIVYSAFDPDLDRQVAIKLLRADALGGGQPATERDRFLREARAMAKLSHPNVLTVHEVGTVEEEVFIAMEFAPGGTLRDWGEREERSWREVLAAFCVAGRGLAAAHDAGLVHRDFKPDNVLLTKGGQFCVADFGIVGISSAELPAEEQGPSEGSATGESPTPDRTLTRTGALLGTPAYMAPEQRGGQSPSPAADQFSFCASLYELLYGKRPFTGLTFDELTDSVHAGIPTSPPHGTDVPAWVHRILARGLAVDPTRRFSSMRELVAALAADPVAEQKQRRRRLLVGGTILFLAGLALFGLLRGTGAAQPPCRGFESKLAGTWDDDARAAIESSFRATAHPNATKTFGHLRTAMDDYAAQWVRARTDACEDTRVRGDQSEALMDLRTRCLDRRLLEVRAFAEVLAAGADTSVLVNSVQAAHSLPGLQACEDVDALASAVPLPDSPEARAEVERLNASLAEARALEVAGKYNAALAQTKILVAEADKLGFPPVVAEAHYRLGSLHESVGDLDAAVATLERALTLADRARDDALRADTAVLLARVVGVDQADRETGIRYAESALAIISRLPTDPSRIARLHDTYGVILEESAQYEGAQKHYERAIAGWSAAGERDGPHMAYTLTNQGLLLKKKGEYDRARELIERALEILTETLGPEHPSVAMALSNLGTLFQETGHPDRAISLFERALVIDEAVFGLESTKLADVLNNLANALSDKGETDRAIDHLRRAAALYEAELGPDHPDLATPLTNLGNELETAGDQSAALDSYRRALSIRERALGGEHPSVANSLIRLAELLAERGSLSEALLRFERALEICSATSCSAIANGLARFGTASCLGRTGGDLERARSLAEEAMAIYDKLPEASYAATREKIASWLRAHSK